MNDVKKPDVVCDLIIENEGKILMGKRGNVFGKGSWALVGGHLEFNETTQQCIKRELMEETGIVPIKMELLGIINDLANLEGQPVHHIRFIYRITEYSGDIENKEPDRCEGWEWFDKDHLPEPLFVGHKKVLEFYRNENRNFLTEE